MANEAKTLPYLHRDISWLSFNRRVLQEAEDPNVPLLERLKFLAIYSSNLDEFFKVRVAHHRNLMLTGKKTQKILEFSPKEILKDILKIVNKQQVRFSEIFEKEIIPELSRNGINILRRLELNKEQQIFVEEYFNDNLLPFVQPVLLVKGMVRPFLNNAELYLSLHLKRKGVNHAKSEYAIVKVPSDYSPRFVEIPSRTNRKSIIILDDIVRHNVSKLFPGYDILDTYSIKLTRDAELYLDDEYQGDLVAKIKKSLTKRNVGPASRFVYDREMPNRLLNYLTENFEVESSGIYKEGRYHNNFDFFSFPHFGKTELLNKELPPISYKELEEADDLFESIQKKDHMIHVPYHSYESVVRFFEDASTDPEVTHIKIVQYRVARKSRIMNALMNAAQSGKQVTVFVEVKARFDEEANLRWGEKLEKAGVEVHYSFPGLKVHSKLGWVRKEGKNNEVKFYAYLGTGNFHEKTARVYSDFGIFTADERLTHEVARVFNFLETVTLPKVEFSHLLVGQFNLRTGLVRLIDQEIAHAEAGREAYMILKMNSLEDKKMINKLYEASKAGVRIDLIVRGICCIVPGIVGISENIRVISIVDRFLEHARVFWFLNDGNDELFLSSADFMRRNLSYRIETTFPVYDVNIKEEIKALLLLQLGDNVKARIIDIANRNHYNSNDGDIPIRSQIETYHRILRRTSIKESESNQQKTKKNVKKEKPD